jgi:hypothetical protein
MHALASAPTASNGVGSLNRASRFLHTKACAPTRLTAHRLCGAYFSRDKNETRQNQVKN